MQIIRFKKFSVPVSTGTSKGDKLLTVKIPLDSISDSLIFRKFPGGMLPDPLVLVCSTCLYASHTMRVHIPVSPTSKMMTDMTVLPFKSLDLPLICILHEFIPLYINIYIYIYISCVTVQ